MALSPAELRNFDQAMEAIRERDVFQADEIQVSYEEAVQSGNAELIHDIYESVVNRPLDLTSKAPVTGCFNASDGDQEGVALAVSCVDEAFCKPDGEERLDGRPPHVNLMGEFISACLARA